MEEVWKGIEGWVDYYEISTFGRVKFLKRLKKYSNGQKPHVMIEYIKKNHLAKRGYYVVDLQVNNVRKTVYIHRLIAIHFIDNPDNLKYVNHIDGNPLNNAIDNLEWCTNMENVCHAKRKAKSSSNYIGVGWDKYANKWKSQIYYKGKSIHLGSFEDEEEAYKVRLDFEKEHNINNKYS